jgi:hypothetical protein
MEYKIFYSIIRQYACKKIGRERFVLDWSIAQKEQRIAALGNKKGAGK